MQKANDITIAAYKAAFPLIDGRHDAREFGGIISQAMSKLGSRGGAMVSFGASTLSLMEVLLPQKK